MSSSYKQAVSSRKLGKAALDRGDKKEALRHFRRSLASMKVYRQKAQGKLKDMADKAIRTLENDIARLEGTGETPVVSSSQRSGAKTTTPRTSAETAKSAEKWSGDLSSLPEPCTGATFEIVQPKLTFDDVAGMQPLKDELRLAIELPLKNPEEFKRRGISPKTGVLLYGPPGCGKTFIVTCAGGEFNLPVVIAKADQLVDSYVGNTEKNVAQAFRCTRALQPSILMVDEIDTLLPAEKHGSDVMSRAEGIFLQELSGVSDSEEQMVFMAATNKPWNLNPALIRPGRIDRIVYVPAPDEKARQKLFELHLRKNKTKGIDFGKLSDLTHEKNNYQYSASGIAQVCETAVIEVIKEQYETGKEDMPVEMHHIEAGLSKTPRSVTPEMRKQYDNFAEKFASFKS
jgi:SpoVK/Ycf46/Vps4 family AAA+-type ATPase